MNDYTCPDCGEACYPDDPCSCRDRDDEIARLTARVAELEAALDEATALSVLDDPDGGRPA
jgi:hypothetical protein